MANTFSKNLELVSYFNPSVGSTQWKLIDSDYDYAQEIARSGYGDMLHDTDRNRKYNLAIQKAIAYRRKLFPTKSVHVLDIGSGTGLLAMMASKAGADKVTACEAFPPVCKCAHTILADNGFAGKIRLIQKRSTDLIVGADLCEPANLLVAELLDTELIGEAALSTYKHAAQHLLTPDATLVPYAADLYVQVVESPFLWSHHRLSSFLAHDSEPSLGQFGEAFTNAEVLNCPGAPSVFDMQVSELGAVDDDFVCLGDRQLRCLLAKPLQVKRFNFSPPPDHIDLNQSLCITCSDVGKRLEAVRTGTVHAFIAWWRLKMEPTGTVPDISTAPKWSGDSDYAWRDHWMQSVYFPHRPISLKRGEQFVVHFSHDSLSLWFGVTRSDDPLLASPLCIQRPVCHCGMHYAWSRHRIAHLNSPGYRNLTRTVLEHVQATLAALPSKSVIDLVIIADCTLLPLLVANHLERTGSQASVNICHVETSPFSLRFLQPVYDRFTSHRLRIFYFESVNQLIAHYKSASVTQLESLTVVAEPYNAASSLPWDSLHFYYAYNQLRSALPMIISNCMLLCPLRLRVWGVLVEFQDLWKIRAPVGTCESFDLTAFDRLVQTAMTKTDALVEPQPLWEYPARARSTPVVVFDMDFTHSVRTGGIPSVTRNSGHFKPTSYDVNGIAFWAEWLIHGSDSTQEEWYSPAGPCSPVFPDQFIRWTASGVHQAVRLAPWKRFSVETQLSECPGVTVSVDFDFGNGELNFLVNGIFA